jgi:hypothetical protein
VYGLFFTPRGLPLGEDGTTGMRFGCKITGSVSDCEISFDDLLILLDEFIFELLLDNTLGNSLSISHCWEIEHQ